MTQTAYHGTPVQIARFAGELFLARDIAEARRYGGIVYAVRYNGDSRFQTPTILVIGSDQIELVQMLEENPDLPVYRT